MIKRTFKVNLDNFEVFEPPKEDMVNKPPHYNQSDKIECIDAIEAMLGKEGFIAYLRGVILKYNWRSPHKGEQSQDHEKLQWYNNKLIEVMNKGN